MEHIPIVARPSVAAGALAGLAAARWVVPALFVLTLGVRLLLILAWPQTPFSDGAWYLLRAGEIARGMGFQEAGHPTAFWPVGFPALLAGSIGLTGSAVVGPALVNLASAAATLALILWFARALGVGEPGARIAGLLYALYPANIVYAGAPVSETSSTALAMAAFALLIAGRRRWPLLILAGLAFGAATLMRAQMLFFPVGGIVALMLVDRRFAWRPALRALLVVHLAMAAVVLPWTLRNERVLGAPVLVSTNGGVALLTGAYDGATGDWTGWENTAVWDRSGIPYAQRVERQVELDVRFKALATQWIAAHPGRWTALGAKKMTLLWRKDSDAFWAMHESYPEQDRGWMLVALADQLYYLALLALSLPALAVGLRGIVRRDGDTARLALLGCMPAFVTLTAFVFTGQIRYHFPAMPFLIVAAGWTLTRFAARLVSRRSGYDRPAA
jgi:4-amino-4-deoxy-L-arabinose transferase-like glycosyltransferase